LTTKPTGEGTGLGSIARDIVTQQHGGTIEFDSGGSDLPNLQSACPAKRRGADPVGHQYAGNGRARPAGRDPNGATWAAGKMLIAHGGGELHREILSLIQKHRLAA
jgi:hypothetical protein